MDSPAIMFVCHYEDRVERKVMKLPKNFDEFFREIAPMIYRLRSAYVPQSFIGGIVGSVCFPPYLRSHLSSFLIKFYNKTVCKYVILNEENWLENRESIITQWSSYMKLRYIKETVVEIKLIITDTNISGRFGRETPYQSPLYMGHYYPIQAQEETNYRSYPPSISPFATVGTNHPLRTRFN